MQLTLKNIQKLLKEKFGIVELIESESASKARFNDRGIVLYKAEYNKIKVALKCFIDIDNEDNLLKAKKEFEYLSLFKSVQGVVNVYGLIVLKEENGKEIGFVLVEDFFTETLGYLIKKSEIFNQKQVLSFTSQMIQTLNVLHYNSEKPLIHCDIKPSNIGIKYINNKAVYILFDFDIAIESNGDREVSFSKLLGLTPEYSAPEILEGINNQKGKDKIISNKADIYSVGIIALQLSCNNKVPAKETLTPMCQSINQKLQRIICPLLMTEPSQRNYDYKQIESVYESEGILNNSYLLIILFIALIVILLGIIALIL
jgi:serine/threonine protein kinase